VFTYETANVKGEIERKFSKFRPKSAKFWRFSGPDGQELQKVSIFTTKGTSIRGTTRFEPFCVKIGWEVWPPGRLGKNSHAQTSYISHIYPEAPAAAIVTKFVLGADFQDLINCAKFHSNPFRGFDFIGGRILAFPI